MELVRKLRKAITWFEGPAPHALAQGRLLQAIDALPTTPDVQVQGADWPRERYYCPKCGWLQPWRDTGAPPS